MGDKSVVDGIISGSQQVGNAKLHNGWAVYSGGNIAQLGIDPATVTMRNLAYALPDQSELYIDCRETGWRDNPNLPEPGVYGMLHVIKYIASRVVFEVVKVDGICYVGALQTGVDDFSGWRKVCDDMRYNIEMRRSGASATRLACNNENMAIEHSTGSDVFNNDHRTSVYVDDNDDVAISQTLYTIRRRNGTGVNHYVYGEHNVTISNTAPSTTLKAGEVHMTY